MTLKDVAKAAGVSPSTVSRVINSAGDSYAGPEVRARIWKAVRELGYVPNTQAKSLKQGAAGLPTGCSIHILLARVKHLPGDSYFAELATYVQEQILRSGYGVGKLYTSSEAKSLKAAHTPAKTDGLVVLGRVDSQQEAFISAFRHRVVYVSLNQKMDLAADHVMCDGVEATHKALEYLYEKGHRHIGYVGEYSNEVRYRTFWQFITDKLLTYSRESIIDTPMTTEGGMAAAEKMMACKLVPSAVFCANDVTAIGFLRGLQTLGYSAPRDISVISIDNIAEAAATKPGLTTVKIPLKDLGGFAVKTLVDRLQKGHGVPLNVFMPSELLVRDSVAPFTEGRQP